MPFVSKTYDKPKYSKDNEKDNNFNSDILDDAEMLFESDNAGSVKLTKHQKI